MIKTFKKVNKTQARKLYNNNKNVYIVPCKVYPNYNNVWTQPIKLNKEEYIDKNYENDFDKIINNFEFYNCNTELGKYTSFYIYE